jgi:lipoprotein-anchoring transpeptidase ErfK/SrfK
VKPNAKLLAKLPRTPRRALLVTGALALIGLTATPAPPVASPASAAVEPAIAVTAPASAPAFDPNAYVIKRALTITEPIVHGFWTWDDKGVPEGPVVITVDTEAQTLSVFRAGYEIGVAVILYGADDKPTPLGVFPITQKKKHHISNIYGAPMPYMQRLTNDGVAIHGSNVREGWGTNGCVGVPTPFAEKLFAVTKIGDPVIITRGERLQVGGEIAAVR